VSNSPQPTDKHVGVRVRMRRLMLHMSQSSLGDALGITFQQIQKYENGKTRVSASRLQEMANVLQVPVPFFFEGLPAYSPESGGKAAAPPPASVAEFLATTDGPSLCKSFMQIKSRNLRSTIVHLVEELTGPDR
jgi:transcriptional regulator with XRE-family HTH domain